MNEQNRLETARRIMAQFANDSGLRGDAPPRRYLWTDAYAVGNYLALHRAFPDQGFLDQARRVVQQVHEVLGKHRADDSRTGWISGLDAQEGSKHPTAGGLRIGKPRPERRPDEAYDAQAEWDQDGQYYHYLTKWMHALHQMARTSEDSDPADYDRWARELAIAAYNGCASSQPPHQLMWKMSIDLSRPLVPATGHHDPLDGLITALVLDNAHPDHELQNIIAALRQQCTGRDWSTDDPLGIGGLLFDAARLVQLPATPGNAALLEDIHHAVLRGLRGFVASGALRQPAHQRLAFRELGLAIGLHGMDLLKTRWPDTAIAGELTTLARQIETFWLQPAHQQQPTWGDHADINQVMLASSLTAPAFLKI